MEIDYTTFQYQWLCSGLDTGLIPHPYSRIVPVSNRGYRHIVVVRLVVAIVIYSQPEIYLLEHGGWKWILQEKSKFKPEEESNSNQILESVQRKGIPILHPFTYRSRTLQIIVTYTTHRTFAKGRPLPC